MVPGNVNQAELKVEGSLNDVVLSSHLQVRVKDRKGNVDGDLGSWRFPLANLITASEMRIPAQVDSLPFSLSDAKYNQIVFFSLGA